MTFKELYEISSEIHFDLFDEVDGSLGCPPAPSLMMGYLKWWKMPLCGNLCVFLRICLLCFLRCNR